VNVDKPPSGAATLPPEASGAPVWGLLAPASGSRTPPRGAEVCVIGGGLSGVATLHWCRAQGLDAILLERQYLAAGASGRNAGFLLRGVAENYARAAGRYGRRLAGEIWEFTAESHARIRELTGSRDVGYRRRGSWTLAAGAEEAKSLEEAATLLAEDGLPGRWTRDLPAPYAHLQGGILNPEDGEVDPLRLVAAIAAPHRPRIFEGVTVTALQSDAAGVLVSHSAGEMHATRVVVATNGLTGSLLPELKIRPVRAQMLATAAPTRAALERPAYAEWGYRYWRQLDDGRVLVGGMRHRALEEEVGTVCLPTARIQAHLDAELRALGVTAPVAHRWAGIMGFSSDGLPLAGPVPGRPHLLVLGGHTGHGLGFAVLAARHVATLLSNSAPIPPWLDPSRPGP
jgi:gamma-glutamylputrescine oxidase